MANYEKNRVKFHSSLYFSDFLFRRPTEQARNFLRLVGVLHREAYKYRDTQGVATPGMPLGYPGVSATACRRYASHAYTGFLLVPRSGFEPPSHLVANQGCVLPLNYRDVVGTAIS